MDAHAAAGNRRRRSASTSDAGDSSRPSSAPTLRRRPSRSTASCSERRFLGGCRRSPETSARSHSQCARATTRNLRLSLLLRGRTSADRIAIGAVLPPCDGGRCPRSSGSPAGRAGRDSLPPARTRCGDRPEERSARGGRPGRQGPDERRGRRRQRVGGEQAGQSVSRIDRRTELCGADPRGQRAGGIAVGAGAVWVANTLDGSVSRIDPETNAVVETMPNIVTPTEIAAVRLGLGHER